MIIEIGFYALMVLIFYGYLILHYGSEITNICRNHYLCDHFVQGHSILGLEIDTSDNQWREFRNSLPLAISAAVFMTLAHEILRYAQKSTTIFHFITGLCFLVVQHGWHSIVVLIIILISFMGCKYFEKRQFGTIWTWCCGILLILLKESYRIQYRPGFEVNGRNSHLFVLVFTNTL